jgi:uncharacterized coiled-coil DUF342 family protein
VVEKTDRIVQQNDEILGEVKQVRAVSETYLKQIIERLQPILDDYEENRKTQEETIARERKREEEAALRELRLEENAKARERELLGTC